MIRSFERDGKRVARSARLWPVVETTGLDPTGILMTDFKRFDLTPPADLPPPR
jgi:hypothetical protein